MELTPIPGVAYAKHTEAITESATRCSFFALLYSKEFMLEVVFMDGVLVFSHCENYTKTNVLRHKMRPARRKKWESEASNRKKSDRI